MLIFDLQNFGKVPVNVHVSLLHGSVILTLKQTVLNLKWNARQPTIEISLQNLSQACVQFHEVVASILQVEITLPFVAVTVVAVFTCIEGNLGFVLDSTLKLRWFLLRHHLIRVAWS